MIIIHSGMKLASAGSFEIWADLISEPVSVYRQKYTQYIDRCIEKQVRLLSVNSSPIYKHWTMNKCQLQMFGWFATSVWCWHWAQLTAVSEKFHIELNLLETETEADGFHNLRITIYASIIMSLHVLVIFFTLFCFTADCQWSMKKENVTFHIDFPLWECIYWYWTEFYNSGIMKS